MTAKTSNPIRLSKVAPWNADLRNTYRQRYTQVGGRYFKLEADHLDAPWFVYEINADGTLVDGRASIALCFNLTAARQAIQDLIDGMSPDDVFRKAISAPRAGTGRNHPKHVERRRAWRG